MVSALVAIIDAQERNIEFFAILQLSIYTLQIFNYQPWTSEQTK